MRVGEYQLSHAEYEALGKQRRRRPWPLRSLRIALALVALSAVVGVLVYFDQWLFALLLLGFLFFSLWYAPRYLENDFFENDEFKSGAVEFSVAPDFIRLQSGDSVVQLPYEKLKTLWEYEDHFVLYHYCGITAKIPKSALSAEELETLQAKQSELPRIARRMYT